MSGNSMEVCVIAHLGPERDMPLSYSLDIWLQTDSRLSIRTLDVTGKVTSKVFGCDFPSPHR